MCELTYVHTGQATRNKIISYCQAFVNAYKHKDGVGFSSGLYVWKSALPANTITNLMSSIIRFVKTDDPIIVHTRFATTGTGGVKDVTDGNAHPFLGQRYVFAHNGTLHPRVALTKEEKDIIGTMTDSEYFFHRFEESKLNDPILAMSETMKNFTGKFAFLLYDDKTNTRYAIRGTSAALHWIPISQLVDGVVTDIGFVINTEKDDLIRGLVLATNLCQGVNKFLFDSSRIVELEKDTAYNISGITPVKAGTVIENFPPATTYNWPNQTNGTYYRGNANTTVIKPNKFVGSVFTKWCLDNFITPQEMDLISRTIYDLPLASLTTQELGHLDTIFVPEMSKFHDANKTLIMDHIVEALNGDTRDLYEQDGIIFPYMLNDIGSLKRIARLWGLHIELKKGDKHAKVK